MGLSLKKVLKKVEKTVKKVAPAALTVVNPALGVAYSKAAQAYKSVTSKMKEAGTSGEIQLISNVGATGMTTPVGITTMTGPAPEVATGERFDAWARGGYGKSVGQTLRSPVTMVVLAGVALVLLLVLIRRK